ncbi:HPr kinase/phosphorylase [Novosphingobium lentum]|uniref:HPr kinase/phosphorylase n=1 Tax=Novosphingobium lentum TaxID=145287 RepID=UPI00082B5259|nr:HPr kinase/phosphatase C-terminal domain-containing protein [Novosphingobium lentum]
MTVAHQATCVAVRGRGLLIEGPPGSGKSSLALALIDRGAVLVGDDGVLVEARDGRAWAAPHPLIAGKLEVRNLGLIDLPVAGPMPLALVIRLDDGAERYIAEADAVLIAGCMVPLIRLWPDTPILALRAELALDRYGLAIG